ncbi:MAG: ribulose phosphate epimerase [Myxococcota bacterium]
MKNTRIWWPVVVVLGVAVTACGTVDADGDSPAIPSDDDQDDDDDDESFGTTGPVVTTGSDEQETGDDDDEPAEGDSDTGCAFIGCVDVPDMAPCDLFAQDCPAGQKCMPWANDGGTAWNAYRCSPIAENPGQPGDECTVEGSGVSGVDDCELAAMCWDVDPDTNIGTCVAMCTGDESDPQCEDPDTTCVNVNIVLCLPVCDPLLQDCPEGQACYGIDDDYTCAPDASGEMGVFGDPCEFINACDPGLFCANAVAVPNCQGSIGCCSEFCDLDEPSGDAQCSGQAGGQECLAMTDNPQPGYEAVGGCAIP